MSSTTSTSTVSAPPISPKKINGKLSVFSHIKYEHMVAGISGIKLHHEDHLVYRKLYEFLLFYALRWRYININFTSFGSH